MSVVGYYCYGVQVDEVQIHTNTVYVMIGTTAMDGSKQTGAGSLTC